MPRASASLSALYFQDSTTGTTQVSVANNASFQNMSSYTVEMMVYLDAVTSNTVRLSEYISGANGWEFLYFGQGIRLNFGNGTTTGVVQQGGTLSANVWHHVAGTWDGSNVRLFIDGVQSGGTVTLGAGSSGNPGIPNIIGNLSAGGQTWPGKIAEFRISKVARYVSNFTVPTAPFVTDANTVTLFHFYEGAGTTAVDASGFGNTGTLQGTPLPQWVFGFFPGSGSRALASNRTRTQTRQLVNPPRTLVP